MSNHCIDVVCVGCGNTWCVRGCSSDASGPRPEAAQRARESLAKGEAIVMSERCCRKEDGSYWPVIME